MGGGGGIKLGIGGGRREIRPVKSYNGIPGINNKLFNTIIYLFFIELCHMVKTYVQNINSRI